LYFETSEAGAEGTEVVFEVRIRDSFSVLRGEGRIVRATDEGVFVRLAYLDQPSLKLLPKIVDHYRRQGVPLLDLTEVEVAEATEAEESPVADEPSADDLWPEEETVTPDSAVGLTLDDLEAEFLAHRIPSGIAQEPPVDAGAATEAVLIDASKLGTGSDVENETLAEARFETEPEVEPPLIDPQDLIADSPGSQEAFAPGDIHLNELLTAEQAAGLATEQDSAFAAQEPEASVGELQIDPGLPWLPDEEPEKKGRRDLWLILVLIVLGAALGAAFYFFFLRPGEASSRAPAAPVEVRARVVPAASPVVDSAPIAIAGAQPQPEARGKEVALVGVSATPQPTAPEPRSSDVSADPLTGVDRITWVNEPGETIVTFWGDGLFVAEQVDDFRVAGGTPREVVRIRGVRRPFTPQEIELDTAHVLRIRVGLHEESDGRALHFVADLVDGDVEILRTEAAGEQLRVYFSKTG